MSFFRLFSEVHPWKHGILVSLCLVSLHIWHSPFGTRVCWGIWYHDNSFILLQVFEGQQIFRFALVVRWEPLQLTNGRSHKLAVEVFGPRQLQVTVILGFKHPRNPAAGCICLHASWRLNMFIRWYPWSAPKDTMAMLLMFLDGVFLPISFAWDWQKDTTSATNMFMLVLFFIGLVFWSLDIVVSLG